MKEATTSSISFLITAIYTYTFANAVYRVFQLDEATSGIGLREDISWVNMIFMIVCITMTLRFLFGNNSYVEHLFATALSPWKRFYHLTVIISQSVILLISSHVIANPQQFLIWMAILFGTEVAWYLGCMWFLREAISKNGTWNRPLLANEIANLAMVGMAGTAAAFWATRPTAMAIAFTAVFIVNTGVDLKVNLAAYMGEGTVGT